MPNASKMRKSPPRGYVITAEGLTSSSAYSVDDTPPADDEVAVCLRWIDAFAKPTKAYMRNSYSYTVKHVVEDWAETYVTNGAFIMAASIRGYRIQPIDFGPNAFFNMCLPGWEWTQVPPIGFSRWLFAQRDRRGSIGDLARDAVEDDSWLRRGRRFIQFWMYLQSVSAIDGCMDALVRSWREFSGEMPPVPDSVVQMNCHRFYDSEVPVLRLGDSYRVAPDGETYIYVLFEAETNEVPVTVKYVGVTKNPAQRLHQHVFQPGTRDKLLWVAELLKADVYPLMGIIDLVSLEDSSRLEKAYMYAFDEAERRFDAPLGEGLLNKLL